MMLATRTSGYSFLKGMQLKVCLFALALVASMLAFVPAPASADIGPCNHCADSPLIMPGSAAPLLPF